MIRFFYKESEVYRDKDEGMGCIGERSAGFSGADIFCLDSVSEPAATECGIVEHDIASGRSRVDPGVQRWQQEAISPVRMGSGRRLYRARDYARRQPLALGMGRKCLPSLLRYSGHLVAHLKCSSGPLGVYGGDVYRIRTSHGELLV